MKLDEFVTLFAHHKEIPVAAVIVNSDGVGIVDYILKRTALGFESQGRQRGFLGLTYINRRLLLVLVARCIFRIKLTPSVQTRVLLHSPQGVFHGDT